VNKRGVGEEAGIPRSGQLTAFHCFEKQLAPPAAYCNPARPTLGFCATRKQAKCQEDRVETRHSYYACISARAREKRGGVDAVRTNGQPKIGQSTWSSWLRKRWNRVLDFKMLSNSKSDRIWIEFMIRDP
jgi:hypothetical protein